jgi:hypothetical protein
MAVHVRVQKRRRDARGHPGAAEPESGHGRHPLEVPDSPQGGDSDAAPCRGREGAVGDDAIAVGATRAGAGCPSVTISFIYISSKMHFHNHIISTFRYAQRCRFAHPERGSCPNVTRLQGTCPHCGLVYRGSLFFWNTWIVEDRSVQFELGVILHRLCNRIEILSMQLEDHRSSLAQMERKLHADAARWIQLALQNMKARQQQRRLDGLLDRSKERMRRREVLHHQHRTACEAQRRWQAARLLQNVYRRRKCAKFAFDFKVVRQAQELARREKEELEVFLVSSSSACLCLCFLVLIFVFPIPFLSSVRFVCNYCGVCDECVACLVCLCPLFCLFVSVEIRFSRNY